LQGVRLLANQRQGQKVPICRGLVCFRLAGISTAQATTRIPDGFGGYPVKPITGQSESRLQGRAGDARLRLSPSGYRIPPRFPVVQATRTIALAETGLDRGIAETLSLDSGRIYIGR
jgi:hypothetical protein